jgi:hypothetical protein
MNDYYGMDYANAEALESAMETLEIAFWVSAILSVALFIKLWIMCNNVRDIKKQNEAHTSSISQDELLYLFYTNDPAFNNVLMRAIYNDLYHHYSSGKDGYQYSYNDWLKVCENNKWKFPEQLEGVDTLEKFKNKFIFVFSNNIRR